jgi:hypothetical protein
MSDKQEYQRNPTFYSGEGTPAPRTPPHFARSKEQKNKRYK